jgi:hypothetical protein
MAGKVASPVTLKTFIPTDVDVAGMTPSQYLARLAAEATSVINAADYGRIIFDLASRRALLSIAEDMRAAAMDAPPDISPRDLIEDAEKALYEVAEVGRYDGVFNPFSHALTISIDMAARAYQRDGRPGLPLVWPISTAATGRPAVCAGSERARHRRAISQHRGCGWRMRVSVRWIFETVIFGGLTVLLSHLLAKWRHFALEWRRLCVRDLGEPRAPSALRNAFAIAGLASSTVATR